MAGADGDLTTTPRVAWLLQGRLVAAGADFGRASRMRRAVLSCPT
ncbi:hypothetical protein [Streptomyces sp. NPDC017941]